VVRGIDGYAPVGNVTVLENGTIVRGSAVPVAKSSSANSSAIIGGFSPSARTVKISYMSLDAYYYGITAITIPILAPHGREARH
jgi:hypothetical protein